MRGQVIDRAAYTIARTPDDPSYYHGNQLVLPAPPRAGEVGLWTRRFAEEIGADPQIRHVSLRWDGVAGDPGARVELEAAGFVLETDQVMTAGAIVAPPAVGVELRPLDARELPATAELAFLDGTVHDDAYRAFLMRRAAWQQLLVASGRAMWWGAFDGDALVGSLGLVALGGRSRYQDVQTRASHRRRGIASALLAAAAAALLEAGELVIVVAPESEAARVYARVGFTPVERVVSACRAPQPG